MKVNVESLRNEHRYKEMEIQKSGSSFALFFFPFYQGVNGGEAKGLSIQNYHLEGQAECSHGWLLLKKFFSSMTK